MPVQILANKDETRQIMSSAIAGFDIEKHGSKYRVIARLKTEFDPDEIVGYETDDGIEFRPVRGGMKDFYKAIIGLEIQKRGKMFALLGMRLCNYDETVSFGDFDTLPDAVEFHMGLVQQINGV
jgi:hypothetical protein